MARRSYNALRADAFSNVRDGWDPKDLLHPAQAFEHPSHVVNDPDLNLNEKRAILASWASDASALECAPHLRCAPHGTKPVLFDEVMEALRALDKEAHEGGTPHYRRVLRQGRVEPLTRPSSGERRSIN
jgi:hypothetical protein